MAKFDFSKHELPTPYEQELLGIFREECAEASIRASKLQRFGAKERQPGQDFDNVERLSQEIGDIAAVIDLLRERGLISESTIKGFKNKKLLKLPDFMKHEPD